MRDRRFVSDIFRGNTVENGLVMIELSAESIAVLSPSSVDCAPDEMVIDLEQQIVRSDGVVYECDVDPGVTHRLVKRLRSVGQPLRGKPEIVGLARPYRAGYPWFA